MIPRRFIVWLGLALVVAMPGAAALMQEGSAAQEFTVPATTDYLVLGMGVVVLILGIWAVRMAVRFRTLNKDKATLEALGDSETSQ